MPRYYIDTDDAVAVRDDEGHDYIDADAMRRAVRLALTQIIRDGRGHGPEAYASAAVRDETGRCVMQATLTLTLRQPD